MVQELNGIKYKFFWGGVFSNWAPSPFILNDIHYNCGEQYMMYQKAMFFNDIESAEKILQTDSPREQKALGRKVKNFDSNKWDLVKYDVMKIGLAEKFKQNPILKSYLLNFKGFVLVEASPEDRIWGIGYAEDKAIENIDQWGENLLGKILTELSVEL